MKDPRKNNKQKILRLIKTKQKETIVATAKYGINFPAIVAKENILGVQFHPEKSSTAGEKLILGFLLNL